MVVVGIKLDTVYKWLNSVPDIREALNERCVIGTS